MESDVCVRDRMHSSDRLMTVQKLLMEEVCLKAEPIAFLLVSPSRLTPSPFV